MGDKEILYFDGRSYDVMGYYLKTDELRLAIMVEAIHRYTMYYIAPRVGARPIAIGVWKKDDQDLIKKLNKFLTNRDIVKIDKETFRMYRGLEKSHGNDKDSSFAIFPPKEIK